MSAWLARILDAFAPDLARLWIAVDPDHVLGSPLVARRSPRAERAPEHLVDHATPIGHGASNPAGPSLKTPIPETRDRNAPVTPMLLDITNLSHRRGDGAQSFTVEVPRLALARGEVLAIAGPSGSGKSTVLELLGLATPPRPGADFTLADPHGQRWDIGTLWQQGRERVLSGLRAAHIGFVLQSGGLLPFLTVADNLALNRRLLGLGPRSDRLDAIIGRLNLAPLLGRVPQALSIGQYQRAVIARALAHEPALILADEPTSALDPRLADAVMALLLDCAHDTGAAVLLATHEESRISALGLRALRAAPLDGGPGYGCRFAQ